MQANGVGFTGEFAADDDRFIPSLPAETGAGGKKWRRVRDPANLPCGCEDAANAGLGRRSCKRDQGDAGPFASAIMPRALLEEEILDITRAFADTTRRAIVAGFDGVERHGAHGFLIQNFFSPHSNRREDQWGGSLANRMRFPLAVVAALERTIEEHADPVRTRLSHFGEEGVDGGLQIADSLELVTRLIDAGANYIHASLGSALDQKPSTGRPDATIVSVLHEHIDGRVPLIAAGGIGTSGQAERALEMGLSVAAVGQGFVMNPDWIARA